KGGRHVELISFGESAEANQCAGDAGEREEVLSFALVATMESAASGQPGHGALDLPAVAPQPLGGLHTLAGQAMGDSAFAEPLAQVVVVVAFVSVELAWFGWPAASPGPDGGIARISGCNAWLSCRFAPEIAMEIGSPVRSVIKWILAPFLPRSTGLGPVRSPL